MKTIYLKRLQNARGILEKENLDLILVYSSLNEYRYGFYFTGIKPKHFHYYFITKKSSGFIELNFLMYDLKKHTSEKVIKLGPENNPLINFLVNYKNVGILGEAPFSHLNNLNKKIKFLSQQFQTDLLKKSQTEILKISQAAKALKLVFKKLNTKIKPGMTQNEIAQIIKFSILKKCNDLAFPITITSGSDLQKTTVDFPSNKLIKQNDAICIDIGAIYQGFYSDSTRMYFTGKHVALERYKKLKQIHNKVLSELKVGMTFKEVYHKYQNYFKVMFSNIKYQFDNFLGHSIGFCLHEQPYFIYKSDCMKEKIIEGYVFTLEPDLRFKDIELRIEDMLAVVNGKIKILTL